MEHWMDCVMVQLMVTEKAAVRGHWTVMLKAYLRGRQMAHQKVGLMVVLRAHPMGLTMVPRRGAVTEKKMAALMVELMDYPMASLKAQLMEKQKDALMAHLRVVTKPLYLVQHLERQKGSMYTHNRMVPWGMH